jgi:hypothetical protein
VAGITKIDLYTHRYRVVHGEETIGHFSNRQLACQAARERRDAIVLDVSMTPPKVVYKDGKWLDA